MASTVTAAVLHEPHGQFVFEQVDLDELHPDEALVRVEASGICHTDIGAQDLLPMPAVLGHEGTGVVEQVGAAVTQINTGDQVIMSYGHCGACPNCQDGLIYICENSVQGNFGGRRYDGSPTVLLNNEPVSAAFFQQSSFASHAVVPARDLVVASDLEPALRAALPCGVITGAGAILNSMKVGGKDSLVVFGAGTVGLSAVMAGRIAGAWPLIAVDINAERLELALELGATHAFNARDGDVVERVKEICPRGVRFTFETSGNEQALDDAIESLGMAGECGMVTVPHYGEKFAFTPYGVFVRAATLRGVFFGSAVPATFIPKLIELHREGRFPYERLIKTYPFSDINTAFAETEQGTAIKPVLLMD